MASPFQKYQGEQVQQLAPGFIEAYGRAGQSIGAGISSFGQSVGAGIAEYYKKKQENDLKQATAQGLVDSYTNGDYESALFNDSTPNHVRSFVQKTMEAGGMDNLKPMDINAFLAGEQAYSTQLERSYKQQAIDVDRIKAAGANAPKPVTPTQSIELGQNISKSFSPAIQQGAEAEVPTAPEILSGYATAAASKAAQEYAPAKQAKTQYEQSRVAAEKSEQELSEAPKLEAISDISGYEEFATSGEQKLVAAQAARDEALAKARRDMTALQQKQQEANTLAMDVFRRTLNDPATASRAIKQRQDLILQGIQIRKQMLAQGVDTATYGPQAAVIAGQITADDIKAAELAAKDFPMGTKLQNSDGSGFVFENGSFQYKSAEQLKGPANVVELPSGFDPSKPYGGFAIDTFQKFPIEVQDKMIAQMKDISTIANNNAQAAMNASQFRAISFTADRAFGWEGTIPESVTRRKAQELISGRAMTERSINDILKVYQKGVGRAIDAEARAVFRATRPFLIASIRPMVAGGNQQSNMELVNILAAIPEGENITSFRPYEEAQYRLLKVMYSRQFDNFMSAQMDMKYVGGNAPNLEWQNLNSRTKVLIEDFMTARGQFDGLDAAARMTLLQQTLNSANEKGSPYVDGMGQPLMLYNFDKGILTGPVNDETFVNGSVTNQLTTAEKAAGEDPKATETYLRIRGSVPQTPTMQRLTDSQ